MIGRALSRVEIETELGEGGGDGVGRVEGDGEGLTRFGREPRGPASRRRGAGPRTARLLLAAIALAYCAEPRPAPAPSEPATESEAAGGALARWVTIYDPDRASNGYTLVLLWRRVPALLDMNGRTVHSWPEARVRSRVRLLPDGNLLGIALGRAVVEYDWTGELVWEYGGEEVLPHHDVIRLANGNTMLVVSAANRRTDDLLEVDRAGDVVWQWRSARHLAYYWEGTEAGERGEITHINSVQELPDNRLFRGGDRRFRPGNLLISARNLNAVFVIDRATKQVVWTYDRQLDLQHEALMTPPEMPGEGLIQLFDNGYRNTYAYRKSAVLEIDPADGSLVWEYRSDDFYSPTGGVQQALPNGNVLIGSSRGGRAFEVTRQRQIVWQWTPPFEPVRPRRYAYDHCPQLASLPRPAETAVVPEPGYRYVDRRVYGFAPKGAMRDVVVDGRRRSFLASNNTCQRLLLPADATLRVAYGLHRRRLRRLGQREFAARFGVRLELDGGETVSLLEDTVDLDGGVWRGWNLDLGSYAYRWVDLCVETEVAGAPGDGGEEFVYWENPSIRPLGDGPADADPALAPLTPEELEVRQQHLRTLGYVD